MPGTVAADGLKRKRAKAPDKSKKRAKAVDEGSDSDGEVDYHAEFLALESEILESKKNYNNITTLIEAAQGQDGDKAALATVSLCRVFLRLQQGGHLVRKDGQSEKEVVVVHWLRKRLGEYKTILASALAEEGLASTALTLAMRLLKAESQRPSDTDDYNFPRNFMTQIVDALIKDGTEDVRQEFCENFLGDYADIRFYTFKAISDILSEVSEDMDREELFDNAFEILSFFEDVPESKDQLGDFYTQAPKKKAHPVASLFQQKKQAQGAWLALMNLGLARDQRKKILEIMTRSVAPWFTQPEVLMDFLTDSYNTGGATSLLALSGVFYLIQERNLDYPSFYRKLYSLLDPNILHSKHRSRFFRLLDTFLSSTHLPAAMVASFIKRMTRLCLNAPPSAIVAVVPWVYNLFKKHPMCTFMIHRELRTEEEREQVEREGFNDPFVSDEEDPMETKAIDSCLWEVVQLQSHYHPNVATIANIISEQFTKQSYNIEDFLDHSYNSLMEAELAKQVKKLPVVEYMIPKRVFLPHEPTAEAEDNLIAKIWDCQ